MGGSQIYLEEGEVMTVEDLMKGISVASANDATVAMAEYISGSEEKFVKRMNDVVKKLGLKNTHFVNCTGLDEKDHYSSSEDMAIVARELVVHYPEIIRFSSIYEMYGVCLFFFGFLSFKIYSRAFLPFKLRCYR